NVPMTIDSPGILAFTELFAGRSDEVLRRAAEGRRLSDEIRHDFGRADTVVYFGILRHEQGELGGAIQAYEETLGFARAAGHVGAEVSTAPLIAHAYRDAGAFDRAAQRLDEGEAGARQHMDQWVGWILTERARLAIAQGRPADARAMIEQASAHRAVFLHLLAEVSAAL